MSDNDLSYVLSLIDELKQELEDKEAYDGHIQR
jgi:hypothetical protein